MWSGRFVLLFLASSLTSSQNGISNNCVLPSYPENGGYVVSGRPEAIPGQAFDTALLNVTCQPGFTMVGRHVLFCLQGLWSDTLPECVRSCRLDEHPSVKYRCVITGSFYEEGYRDCGLYELVGTMVKPECNVPIYYRTGVLPYMRCTNTGWNYVARCTPECGRITSEGSPQILGGRHAEHGEFPWHAGIYTKTSTPYEQICGGSLVSTTAVLSAAHCFWNYQRGKLHQASRYVVAVGKLYRPWDEPHDINVQKSDVSEIRIPHRFQGSSANFQEDIAIVILASTIVYRTHVQPVCVDFDEIFEKTQLQPGRFGKVAGWGLTAANGTPSSELKVLETPYVDVAQCINDAPPGFIQFITGDKICAGLKDGKAVCKGDSGGGLVFSGVDRGIERYYLRGVVSTAPKSDDDCNAFAITTYTQITAHATFIEENTIIDEIPNKSSDVTVSGAIPPLPAPPPRQPDPVPVPSAAAQPIQCGVVAEINERQPPVFNDQRYTRGDWPWLVAIYKRKDDSLTFTCAGTLVSERHVVTAAQCIHVKNKVTAVRDIVVKVGVYNLEDWGDDITVTRTLTDAYVHESYSTTTHLTNDILVLTFQRSVEFNTYIRPACLWSGNSDLSKIVGTAGVGLKGGINKGRWTLRAVVSLSLPADIGDSGCNLNEYAIFTDVAQYLPWIRRAMAN